MKRLLATLLLVLPMLLSAQHLKFMGIPLTGTITSFSTKLKAKGFTVGKYNNSVPKGVRSFDGTFFGNDASVYVYYDPRTSQVYRAKACIDNPTISRTESLFDEVESSLVKKYATFQLRDTQDGFKSSTIPIYNKDMSLMGMVGLYISEHKLFDWSDPTYILHIDYMDESGSEKNQTSKEADL